MIKKSLHIILFLLCSSHWLAAQTPFFRLKTRKELYGTHMQAIFQDHLGWIWLGGKGGLFRYDGQSFQPVPLPDSLAKDPIRSLYETKGQLWVGFESGAICIMPKNTVFLPESPQETRNTNPSHSPLQRWIPEEGNPRRPVTGFCATPNGDLWISTYGEGLYCWKNKRLYQFNTDDGLASTDIYAISCDNQGQIWTATDAGISICSMPEPGKKKIRNITTADGLPDEIVSALRVDAAGDMWIGMYEKGICRYKTAQRSFDFPVSGWTHGPVTSLVSFGSQEIWAGTANHGLIRIDLQAPASTADRCHPLPEQHPLCREKITALCKDREGLLWVLENEGAIYSANVRIGLLATPSREIQAVCVDRQGRLWAGTEKGLMVQENGQFRQALPLQENIISLWEASDGNIWAGSFGNGVFVLHPEGRVLRHLTEKNGLTNGSVLSITGHAGTVWLATLGGVTEVNQNNFSLRSYQAELGAGYIYAILADSKGRIWFGTDGEGLIVLENGAFRHIRQAANRYLKTVYSIVEDPAGNIWFSSESEGLFCYTGQSFRRFSTEHHLHSQNITGLAVDGNGLILLAYEDGVDILTPGTGHVAFFDAASGAPAAKAAFNSICRDRNGHVWMGADAGILRLARFDEAFVFDPEPNITAVSVFLQPVDFWTTTVFPHDQNYFVFNFVGLWFTNPELVRYRYRLDGSDADWVTSKEHFASYPNLPPGQYTFRLQTSEHGNFSGTPEITYSFTIRKPIWKQLWFVLLSLLIASGLLFSFIRSREKRFHREAALRRESVESQFAALKSQINPHFLFNSFNTLITIIEENPKMAVEYVEHFSDFYRTILDYREKDLITLSEELALVRNFNFLLQKRYEDNFRLNCIPDGQPGYIMPLTLQILVENAVKHNVISRAKPLTVDIFVEDDGYLVVRNNNQRKIKPEPGTHFGLHSLVHRYQLLGAKPVIVEDTETYFTVKVPIL